MKLIIRNALIVNADKMEETAQDILIEKGKMKQIGQGIKAEGVKEIDAKGKLILPGLIDIHVHFREPGQEHKETIETGSQAAVKGGFTSVMCMPNTRPVIDNKMIVEALITEAKRVGLCNVIPIGSITKGQKDKELVDMFELKEAGCLALSDDGKSVVNSQVMRMAMEYARMVDILLIQHCEDPLLSNGGAMNEGANSTLLGIKGDPYISESVIVSRDIELAHYLGGKVHLAHMSNRRSLELIRKAKADGIQVTSEVCTHHFTLTDDEVKHFDTSTKMNPPLRTQDDIEAIKEALQDGTIDLIVTDHAPHSSEDKEVDFQNAPFGIIGLETSLGLTVTELVKPGLLSWEQVVAKMSTKQAEIAKIPNKGVIKEGWDADLVIVDPDEEWEVTREDTASKSKNSPFFGRKLTGRVKTTIFGGKVVFEDKK